MRPVPAIDRFGRFLECPSVLQQAAYTKIESGDPPFRFRFVRNARARRYILRVVPGGIARVTIPRGGTLDQAQQFLQRNREWLLKQLAKATDSWTHGSRILIRGNPVVLVVDGDFVTAGEWRIPLGGRSVRSTVESHLYALAAPELTKKTYEFAEQFGLAVRQVSVRNQRTRWGSCSSRGRISLNWRLMQTPEFVSDYIIVHELMHLREMNHSPRFWREVASAYPAYREAERWLRRHAGLLR
ncbi:MAG: DUF45 domain-containing protein [Gammaproteobacteria bacterium]|nr:DUF45 domain-containing protein [Gammaproteobacteria bacterium]